MNGTTEALVTEEGRAAGSGAGHRTEAGPPSWGIVFRSQLRLLLRKKWRLLALLGLAVAVPTTQVPTQSARGMGMGLPEVAANPVPYWMAVLLAVAWAVSIWSNEGPGERAYHWSLPVRGPVHDLTRVAVGGLLFLTVALLSFSVVYVALLLMGGSFVLGDPALLGLSVAGVVLGYLLGTIPALVADHPLRWTVGTILGYLILGGLIEEAAERWGWLAGVEGALKSVWNGAYGLNDAIMAPSIVWLSGQVGESVSPDPVGALVLWLCLAAVAVVSLSLLHLERAKGAAE